MELRLYRAAVFATYQISLLAGITLLPLALVVRKLGVSLPMDRILLRLERAYDRSTGERTGTHGK